jgi:hypothetical protein
VVLLLEKVGVGEIEGYLGYLVTFGYAPPPPLWFINKMVKKTKITMILIVNKYKVQDVLTNQNV